MDIFISYAREDSQSATRLYNSLLEVQGVTPWLDTKRLLPGIRWKFAIMNALKSCDVVILLLSRRTVSKDGFVQREITEALDMLKQYPPDRLFLIPARLEECTPKHPELVDIQWVDLFPEWDVGFEEIRRAIQMRAGPIAESPADHIDRVHSMGDTAPQAFPDDLVIETFTSAHGFMRRLESRGEMRGCDAMRVSFESGVFGGRDFAGGSFVRCHFDRCDFRGANLRGANFEGAVLTDCKLANADLWGVNFWGADLRGVGDLSLAHIKLTNFYGARLPADQAILFAQKGGAKADRRALQLSDYGSFLRYFADEVAMDELTISRTFLWVKHRYFQMMFDKGFWRGN